MFSIYQSHENKKDDEKKKETNLDLTKSLNFGSPSKTARSRSKTMEESRYVKVERVVLCFERADLTSPEGDAAIVGLVVK